MPKSAAQILNKKHNSAGRKSRESMRMSEGVCNIKFLRTHAITGKNQLTHRSIKEAIRIIKAKSSKSKYAV